MYQIQTCLYVCMMFVFVMYLFAHTYKISQLLYCLYVLKDTYKYKRAGSLMSMLACGLVGVLVWICRRLLACGRAALLSPPLISRPLLSFPLLSSPVSLALSSPLLTPSVPSPHPPSPHPAPSPLLSSRPTLPPLLSLLFLLPPPPPLACSVLAPHSSSPHLCTPHSLLCSP